MRFNILAAGYILFEAALAVPYDNFTGGVNLTRQVDSLEDYFTANYSSNDSAIYALSNGVPYAEHPYGSLLANPGGPLLLQDFNLMDSMSHFDRERIPERVVHAKGGGAHGYFELTDSLSDLTFARIFQEPGYTCPITVRFSTVGGERASPDTMRDARGFSIKLKTDIGNMDWVYLNTPVFFLRDPNKFPHFTHAQKRDPSTNLNQWTDSSRIWDYYLQNPEALHQITYMFGDRGCPKSWALMNGYSGHTFKFFNAAGNMTYVKFHLHSEQGVEGFSDEEAAKLHGQTDYNTQEFYNRIASGGKPAWTVYVQTMTPEQAENFTYSVNDLTKVWPHSQFPLRRAGRIIIDQNPVNYFAEVEQAAFSPSHLIPGIEPSNDPVLQSRLYSYPDSHSTGWASITSSFPLIVLVLLKVALAVHSLQVTFRGMVIWHLTTKETDQTLLDLLTKLMLLEAIPATIQTVFLQMLDRSTLVLSLMPLQPCGNIFKKKGSKERMKKKFGSTHFTPSRDFPRKT
ncbi:hypothetical protein BZL39_E00160 [Zygosaccharomyces parabailii]|nr:hypothetical protein BZL39_E00160 [Zygosaccharomyces parabailii]